MRRTAHRAARQVRGTRRSAERHQGNGDRGRAGEECDRLLGRAGCAIGPRAHLVRASACRTRVEVIEQPADASASSTVATRTGQFSVSTSARYRSSRSPLSALLDEAEPFPVHRMRAMRFGSVESSVGMETTNLGEADGLAAIDWSLVAAQLADLSIHDDPHSPNRPTFWLTT